MSKLTANTCGTFVRGKSKVLESTFYKVVLYNYLIISSISI